VVKPFSARIDPEQVRSIKDPQLKEKAYMEAVMKLVRKISQDEEQWRRAQPAETQSTKRKPLMTNDIGDIIRMYSSNKSNCSIQIPHGEDTVEKLLKGFFSEENLMRRLLIYKD